MTTYVAIVKYPLEADDKQKRNSLLEGLSEVAFELESAGMSIDNIERAYEDALQEFLFDRESDAQE